MGPRHRTQALASVLTEPILGAVRAEADEAAASGWFWNIRPLKSRVGEGGVGRRWGGGGGLQGGRGRKFVRGL